MSTPIACSGPRHLFYLLALVALTPPAFANFIGGERPSLCLECGAPKSYSGGKTGIGLTEGNDRETALASSLLSSTGPTLVLNLTYNSYNADTSHALLNTGNGYGWTHSYNIFLFSQLGSMFRMDDAGRTEKFALGPGNTYTADKGYFETLVKNINGSFTLTTKNKTSYLFATVAGTRFQVQGPVYRLQTITDRNNNVTTLTYTGGNLTSVTDTYGRALQFTYNASGMMTTETDPLGRVTTFTYDSTGNRLASITDANGKVTTYTYNVLNQIATKKDGDGRTFTYQYNANLPSGIEDSSSSKLFSLSNPVNWATSFSFLAEYAEREYTPSTTQQTDGRGNVWKYQYDTNGYPTNVIAPDGTTTRYTYDPGSLEISSMTDANGHTTRYQYDGAGNRILMMDAQGNVTTYTYEPVFNQMTSMTDPNGRVTTNNYDANGNRILTTDPLGQTQAWTYDSHGNILTATNKRGYTTQYRYDSSGDLIKKTDALGDITTYTYDAVGNRLTMTDANGNLTQYQYDGLNRLITITDALGYTSSTAYDAVGDVVSWTDANGHTAQYVYDLRDRKVAATNALEGVTLMTYDANNNLLTRTDQNGHFTTFTYDALNRPIISTDPLGHASTMTYDPVGNILSTTDANGHTTTNAYDVLNRKITVVDPLGYVTTYDYASVGGPACCGASGGSDLVTGMIDGDGKYTYYHYDELNRLVQTVRKSGTITDINTPSDAVTTTTYDAENDRIGVTDPNGNTTTMTYDALNRQITMINAAGDVSTTAYDAVGNVVQTVDPRGNDTTMVYDADNREIRRTDSLGPVFSTAYDGVGNIIASTNGNGNVTSKTYDALNRLISVTDPLGHTTSYTYDPVGNKLSETDRDGDLTVYAYDADNRQITLTDPLSETTTTTYDAVGNVIQMTDALGRATLFTYDGDNRRITETYPDTPADTRSYGYDGTGHPISRLDQNGQTTTYGYSDFYYLTNRLYSVGPSDQFTYDLGGRTTSATRGGWVDSFTYDGADRVLTAVQNGQSVTYSYNIPSGIRMLTYPSGETVTESYDLRSRLIEVNDGGTPALTQYTYDLDNNVLTRSYRNGTAATYAYNADDWTTQLNHFQGPTLFAGFAYAYDHEGNKFYQSNEVVSTDSESYAYDARHRLVSYGVGTLSAGVILSPVMAETWNLDAVGNWSSYVSNTVTQNRTHNAVNELVTIVGGANPTYDANGNLLNSGTYTYAYDPENRVTAVTRDSGSTLVGQYFYDAFGRRIITVVSPAGVFETNVMIYDDARILEVENASGSLETLFTYGNSVDEVLTMTSGLGTYYYHPNALLSIVALTDATGTPVERYVYDAYGQPAITDGNYNPVLPNAWGTPHSAIGNCYLFTGRQWDEENGIYFYRARYYDPVFGRWLERDPLLYGDGMNLYEYVKSDPTDRTDWSGQAANGTTKCNLPGDAPQSWNNNRTCARPCTGEHEKVHYDQFADAAHANGACCMAARAAYKKAETQKDKNDVIGKWNDWTGANTALDECPAHTKSVECADRMMNDKDRDCKNCPAEKPAGNEEAVKKWGERKKCCDELKQYRDDQEAIRKTYCDEAKGKTYAACPFAAPAK